MAARNLSSIGRPAEAPKEAEQTTTVKVTKQHSDALRLIAAMERITIFALTERIVGEYIEKYEQVSGQPIMRQLQRGKL